MGEALKFVVVHDEALKAENDRLKALLCRAAEALEGKPVYDALANMKLIVELRKAALSEAD